MNYDEYDTIVDKILLQSYHEVLITTFFKNRARYVDGNSYLLHFW